MLQQISAPAVDPYARLVVHFRVLRSTAARKRLAAAAHGQDVALDDLAGFRFEINLGWQLSSCRIPEGGSLSCSVASAKRSAHSWLHQ